MDNKTQIKNKMREAKGTKRETNATKASRGVEKDKGLTQASRGHRQEIQKGCGKEKTPGNIRANKKLKV